MYVVTANGWINECQTWRNGDQTFVMDMDWHSGQVVINDEAFNPENFEMHDQITVSEYEWEDHDFGDGDGAVIRCADDKLQEEIEAIFEEGFFEALNDAGWEEEDTVVTFMGGFEIDEEL